MDGYKVPADRHRIEEKIGGSLFIATCERVTSADEARLFVEAMKREFRDATHNCHAFVAGPPGGSPSGMNDDGEPKGTAGASMHQVLLHCGIGEVAVVVTRYYGGTKLGTGGLVRAYGGMTKKCVETLPTCFFSTARPITFTAAYGHLATVKHHLEKYEGEILEECFTDRVTLTIRIASTNEEPFFKKVGRMVVVLDEK
ncbi:MAG: YigZ family protein [Desulfobacterales bacterium]|nr:YigZ family protein [Desulfobacterales bacterium]